MSKIRFVLTMVIVFVLVASLTGTAFAAPATRAKWTVMVYISGDNDLESYVISDIETELAPTGSTPEMQVVALADRGPGTSTGPADWTTTKLFHITPGMTADAAHQLADWGERDMANPQTLIEFVKWTRTNYPADHYALIFWGHGWNWHPGYVMKDETTQLTNPNNYTMDYEEQKAAIPSLGFIDVVGYDGCNMASIEIFNLWHGYATAVTSSQEYVGWEGLQYDLVLAQLAAAKGNMTADQVAIAFAQTATADKTWSAVAVDGRLDTLLTAVNDWSIALKNGLATSRKQYDQAFTATRNFWQATEDKDLYDMAYELNRNVTDATVKAKSKAVMNAVDSAVLFDRHANSYAETYGITIYHITKASEKDSLYKYYRSTVDFALQTGWDEFLDAYAK